MNDELRTDTITSIAPTTTEALVQPTHTPYKEKASGPVGRSERRIDGREKVTGHALYVADLFFNLADYFAQVVRSEKPHARVLKIDVAPALLVPGVVTAYTSKDMPGTNRQGLIHRDHPVLAEDKVLYR